MTAESSQPFAVFCRACAKPYLTKVCIRLDSAEANSLKLVDNLHTLGIWVDPNDLLPKYMCRVCSAKLEPCASFLREARLAQRTLRAMLDGALLKTSKITDIVKSESDNSDYSSDDEGVVQNNEPFFVDVSYKCETESLSDLPPEKQSYSSDDNPSDYEPLTKISSVKNVEVKSIESIKKECKSPRDEDNPTAKRKSPRNKLLKTIKKPKKIVKKRKAKLKKLQTDSFTIDKRLVENVESNIDGDIQQGQQTWNDYPWECCDCGSKFNTIRQLREHCMLEHGHCGAFKCVDCIRPRPPFLKIESFIKHVTRHRSYLKTCCFLCNATFLSAQQQNNHKHTAHLHFCFVCGLDFESLAKLDDHIKAFAVNACDDNFDIDEKLVDNFPEQNVKEVLMQAEQTWNDYTWECSDCGCNFNELRELRDHCISEHGHCCTFKCVDCIRPKPPFLKIESFLKHVTRHRVHLKTSCFHCNVSFISSHQQNNHKHSTHLHYCKVCGDDFDSESKLEDHMKAFTLNIGERKCTICDKTFKLGKQFTNHMKIHKPRSRDFSCDLCGKSFYTKASLQAHSEMHLTERTYTCLICNSTYKTSNSFYRHMILHDKTLEVVCDQCGKSFKNKYKLREHLRSHSNVANYACTFCEKRFKHRSNLVTHLRQHTGERPYSCEKCAHSFSNQSNYGKHMKRRHNVIVSKPRKIINNY